MRKGLLVMLSILMAVVIAACQRDPDPESITLSPDPVEVEVGETVTVTATVEPEDASQDVMWETADSGIATVEDGVVTGVAVGTTTLTATSLEDEEVSETINVEVFEMPDSVSLDPSGEVTMDIGDTLTVTATVAPEGADQTVTWSIADESIATIEDGEIAALAEGETKLTVTSTVDENVYAELDIIVIDPFQPEMTISDVWAQFDGGPVDTMGVVTTITDHRTFFIEDADRAIAVYDGGEDFIDDINVGDFVHVVGERDEWNGLHQISALETVEVLDTGRTLPDPQDITDVDKNDEDAMLAYQGHRVSFSNYMVLSVEEDNWGNIDVELTDLDTDETIAIRYDSRLPGSEDDADALLALEEGEFIDILGMVLGWYQGPQLLFTSEDEFALTGEAGGNLEVDYEELDLPFEEYVDYQIIFRITPEHIFKQEATFTSSDDSIATVDEEGVVVPVGLGEVDITVSSDHAANDVVITINVVEELDMEPVTGYFNLRHETVDNKHRMFARAEDWLLRTMAGGIPIMTNDAYIMVDPRVDLPTGEYNPIMGYGVSLADLTEDDSTVMFRDDDDYGNAGEYTLRQRSSATPGTLFSWEYEGSWEADVITIFEDSLFYFDYDEDMVGYEVLPSMAAEGPIPLDVEELPTGKEVATRYQIKIRDDLQWTYHPDIDTSGFEDGHEEITAVDFYETWRMALTNEWFRAISGGGDFTSAPQEVVGAQDYVDRLVGWDEVGIKLIDDYTLEIHFKEALSDWDVRYWMSSFVLSPINLHLYDEVGDQYGTSATTIAAHGPYVMDYYEPDVVVRFSENPNFHEPDRHSFTHRNIYFVPDSELAFQLYLQGYFDTVSVPSGEFEDYKDHPDILPLAGPTTWRLNVNMLGTVENQLEQFPESPWVPEPILGNNDFVLALYHGMDRETLTTEINPINGPNMYMYSQAYMVDPAGGIPFRVSEWADEVAEGMGKDTHGYVPTLAQALFKDAIDDLVADGVYDAGTDGDPTEIELEFAIFADNPAQLALAEFVTSEYESLFYCDTHYIQVTFDIVTKEPGVLYDDMQAGEFDLSFGGISGLTLDAGNFLMVYRDDNMSGFTLNWGVSTSEPEIDVVYRDLETGLWKRGLVSFNALHHMFAGQIYIEDGVPSTPPEE